MQRDTGQTNTFAMMRVMSSQTVMKKASARDEREQKRLEAIEFMSANYVISPDGKFRKRWDAAQIFLLAYVAIVVPYRIGFTHDIVCNKDHCEAFFFWDAIVDLVRIPFFVYGFCVLFSFSFLFVCFCFVDLGFMPYG
eukprot:SAG11_NODE_15_length_26319_cov_13.810564_13_plen_138_part_00